MESLEGQIERSSRLDFDKRGCVLKKEFFSPE
jgi:hypothetical protein